MSVALTGIQITRNDGTVDIIDGTKAPGSTPAQIETVVQNYAAVHYPQWTVRCHCFSASPYKIMLWIASAPAPTDSWWLGTS